MTIAERGVQPGCGLIDATLLATDQICAFIAASAGTSVIGTARRFLQLTWSCCRCPAGLA
jgi:hypothetical protein